MGKNFQQEQWELKQASFSSHSRLKKEKRVFKENLFFRYLSALCAGFILVIMFGILIELYWHSHLSIATFGIKFIYSSSWDPVKKEFGALASIYGTFVPTIIAMLIAVPLSLVISLFLTELAPPIITKPVGYAIELLAGIPSIIYGMWGLFVFAPFMSRYIQPVLSKNLGFLPLFQGAPMGIGILTAGIILSIMILPFITAMMRDVFKMVPAVVKESAYGMGATSFEVTIKVTIRYGLTGLVGACFLGLGRAIGETMAVTFVIGNYHQISASLFSAGNTIASTLANEFAEATEPLYLSSLLQLGLILFLITIMIQVLTQIWLMKIQKGIGKL